VLGELLPTGQEVDLRGSRRRCHVARFLGEGSQGVVYAVSFPDGESDAALKWYHPHTATFVQRQALVDLIERGPPDDRFLWPSELVELADCPGFGYLMPLRPAHYIGLGEVLKGKVSSSYSFVCTLGRELADVFLALHSEGLCYRDINFSNISIDPELGRPLIGDTDNVGIDGASRSAVLGSRRFMAPEIVRGDASPSTATDLFSLAVLLFYLLMTGHPLIGRRELDHACWDDIAEREMFGRSPVFIFDPADPSNAPVPGLHDAVITNWPLHPQFVQKLFVQTFTGGLAEPRTRVRESMWRSALARLGDSVSQCAFCGKENLYDDQQPQRPCWACGRLPEAPLRLQFERSFVVLTETTRLFRHHLHGDYDFTNVVAEVTPHPVKPDVWGIRNACEGPWRVVLADGAEHQVEAGKTIVLVSGATIDFGACSATLTR
jgi:DNA-binding helix-hairpin-helix protein with protein kinase domain